MSELATIDHHEITDEYEPEQAFSMLQRLLNEAQVHGTMPQRVMAAMINTVGGAERLEDHFENPENFHNLVQAFINSFVVQGNARPQGINNTLNFNLPPSLGPSPLDRMPVSEQ